MEEVDSYKIAFIISHRYYRNYKSYIQYYVNNIQRCYSNSFIIIVDNNSTYINDIKLQLENYKNLVILSNNTECKFEIGAYKVGINYLIDNNLIEQYDFYTFTQDNFILKNKYDFNNLYINNITACTVNSWIRAPMCSFFQRNETKYILHKLNLENSIDKLSLCWCNTFILHKSKIIDFLNITKEIIITKRVESECSERYLSGILYRLNNDKIYDIDGDIDKLNYDYWKVDSINDIVNHYFVKKVQRKNENTKDEF